MTIHLPKDMERSINEAVMSGQFASVDDAMAEAARLLLEKFKPSKPAKALTLDELDQQMLAEGLMSQLPNSAEDVDDEDEAPIVLDARWQAAGMGSITLVSADQDLNAAATAEGLMVEDPNAHP